MNETRFADHNVSSSSERISSSSCESLVQMSDLDSVRTEIMDFNLSDRKLNRALKHISYLSDELNAAESLNGHIKSLREKLEIARKDASATVATLNARMDEIERSWDEQILKDQKDINASLQDLLMDVTDEDIADAFPESSFQETSERERDFIGKMTRLEAANRDFISTRSQIRSDSQQLAAMSKNLTKISDVERNVRELMLGAKAVTRPKKSSCDTKGLKKSYRKSINNLDNTIRSLTTLCALPTITKLDPTIKNEVEAIRSSMSDLLSRIKQQLAEGSNDSQVMVSRRKRADRSSSSSSISSNGSSYAFTATSIKRH